MNNALLRGLYTAHSCNDTRLTCAPTYLQHQHVWNKMSGLIFMHFFCTHALEHICTCAGPPTGS